jgi:hypothetical protein
LANDSTHKSTSAVPPPISKLLEAVEEILRIKSLLEPPLKRKPSEGEIYDKVVVVLPESIN